MVTEKQLNPEAFSDRVREFHAVGESIRSRQDEKRVLLADFEAERTRFRQGNISQSALATTAQKTNKELQRLDKEIRLHLTRSNTLLSALRGTVMAQAPKAIRVNTRGAKAANTRRTTRAATRKVSRKTSARKTSRASARRAVKTTRSSARRRR